MFSEKSVPLFQHNSQLFYWRISSCFLIVFLFVAFLRLRNLIRFGGAEKGESTGFHCDVVSSSEVNSSLLHKQMPHDTCLSHSLSSAVSYWTTRLHRDSTRTQLTYFSRFYFYRHFWHYKCDNTLNHSLNFPLRDLSHFLNCETLFYVFNK